jgi:hypothetical protein
MLLIRFIHTVLSTVTLIVWQEGAHQSARASDVPSTLSVAEAVMVTVELDFGSRVPSIADALKDIERRSVPDDGSGRTFSILDAYGEETPDGKLRLSMHVSTEQPGLGSLVFRRTGETLWQARIVQGEKPGGRPRSLGILIDDGSGKFLTVNGSKNPALFLDAPLQGTATRVRDIWPDGAEREIAFVYSACGCPVKVKSRRVGDRIVRTSEMPVMFPDDHGVVQVIGQLLRW